MLIMQRLMKLFVGQDLELQWRYMGCNASCKYKCFKIAN